MAERNAEVARFKVMAILDVMHALSYVYSAPLDGFWIRHQARHTGSNAYNHAL